MSYGIGVIVEVVESLYLGRWIYIGERGEVIDRHYSPAGQDVYDVRLDDGKVYTFAPNELTKRFIAR